MAIRLLSDWKFGDAAFRAKAASILDRFRSERKTASLASHSMHLILDKCNKAIWLEAGEVRMFGEPSEVVAQYTEAQVARVPTGKT